MKLRSSLWIAPIVIPVGVLAVLPLPLVDSDLSYTSPGLWLAAAVASGVLVLAAIGVVLWYPGMDLQEERFLVRGKYGWGLRQTLGAGERWVIAGDQLCLQRKDGSLVKLRVGRWAVNRRDWAELEQTLPMVDRY
ncbi:hypothetical protein [Glycomyces algeriensis]|uniref:Uncharacterized protein n=1 Tax=Glycomyces algeriensis TaxID=256037 RepID=A0A9W6LG26_9ACTN|nr:hypothetical protein [Glycomyces algeriensis]MDA1367111.1 hypothetical protein [Glycomyces algeriensis]MDR7348502.1 hypothetical protein [Glycomyces algeriensis]GLI41206.1 hypothetical protein GALLR39Z86_10560 [Glycomyces algeriensis]